MTDAYLRELRIRLRGVADADDIVAEIRSHIEDAGPDVAATLARLGSPGELASLYAVERSSSPMLLVRGLFRWASASLGGLFAFFALIAGYVTAISLFVAAFAKPFAPHRTGLWRLPGGEISLRLGFSRGVAVQGEELLGWWIVPIGLAAGALVLWLTPRFGRWAIRRFRRTLVVPR